MKSTKQFASYAVKDLDQARQFYGQTLGLEVKDDPMGLLNVTLAGGGQLMIYPKPDHHPATFTVLNLLVPDIDQAVDELSKAGAPFEHYDNEMIKTDAKGIARGGPGPTIAWFKDPSGNLLSVISEG